eukprot:2648457-Pyramimonas_sp.AAC.2
MLLSQSQPFVPAANLARSQRDPSRFSDSVRAACFVQVVKVIPRSGFECHRDGHAQQLSNNLRRAVANCSPPRKSPLDRGPKRSWLY